MLQSRSFRTERTLLPDKPCAEKKNIHVYFVSVMLKIDAKGSLFTFDQLCITLLMSFCNAINSLGTNDMKYCYLQIAH